jgi:hypothetical protein
MNKPLKTVADWKAFLTSMPDEAQILFDTHPLNHGSFEFATPDYDSDGVVAFLLTKYGE